MRPKSPTLTAHELELMKIVWRHDEPVTVRDVYEELRQQRSVAYTTVLTNMKTLEQKGYLRASATGNLRLVSEPVRTILRSGMSRFSPSGIHVLS